MSFLLVHLSLCHCNLALNYVCSICFSELSLFSGGGSSLSRKERDEIRAEVDAEFESEQQDQKKQRRRMMQKKTRATEDDFGSLFGDSITGKLPRYANKITWKVLNSA